MTSWGGEGLDELLLSDPERAIGLGTPSVSFDVFHRWLSAWCRGR